MGIEDEARQERSVVGDATGGARLLEDRTIRVVLEEDPTGFVGRRGHRLQPGEADVAAIFADRKLLVTQILQRPGKPVVGPHRSRPLRLERTDGTWHVNGGPRVEEGEDIAIRNRVRSRDRRHRNPDGRRGRERPAAAPPYHDREGDDDDQRNGRRHQVARVARGAVKGPDDDREQRERQQQQDEINWRKPGPAQLEQRENAPPAKPDGDGKQRDHGDLRQHPWNDARAAARQMFGPKEYRDAEDEELLDRLLGAMMHRGQPEAGQTPQVGDDVVANPGRESHDGGAERDRGAAHVRNPDPLSREVQPEHERADQQRQEKDAVVPDAHAGGETEEGPVVPAAMGRPGDPNREQEAEDDEEEHERVDPRPHAIADGVQRKHRGDARRQQGAPTLPSPASGGGIFDVGEEPAGQRVHGQDVEDSDDAQRETDRELGRAEDRDKGRQHVRLDRAQVMAPTLNDRQVAAQDVDGGDAPGRLVSIEWLQLMSPASGSTARRTLIGRCVLAVTRATGVPRPAPSVAARGRRHPHRRAAGAS